MINTNTHLMQATQTNNCPCGSNNTYADCCGPFLSGKVFPLTAQQLMRSRYTAFTLANADYILRTYHPKTRPLRQRNQIASWAKSVRWLGLQVMNWSLGSEDDQTGYVEFKAHFIENGKPGHIHENSFFKRENGKWTYVSGQHQS